MPTRVITYLLIVSCAFMALFADCVLSQVPAGKQGKTDTKDTEKKEPPKPRPPFDPENLPDPFVSYFVRIQRNKVLEEKMRREENLAREKKLRQKQIAAERRLQELREQKTELQKLEISQLTLTAVVQDGKKGWAMVRDPRGMGFILKKGTAIGTNGGVIKKILYKKRTVVIDEPYLTKTYDIAFKPVELKIEDELFK